MKIPGLWWSRNERGKFKTLGKKRCIKSSSNSIPVWNNHGSKQGSGATTLQLEGELGKQKEEKRWMFIIAILECVYFHYKVRGTDNVEVNILKEQQLSMSSLWASTTRILLGKTPKIKKILYLPTEIFPKSPWSAQEHQLFSNVWGQ